MARRHANALPTKAWYCDITDVISPHGLPTHYKQSYYTIPPIIPLTSDTLRLHQHVSCSPVAQRHANALSTKAAQIRMALRHHERNFATRSAHTLQAIPPIIPLTSNTPRLRMAATARNFATRSAHTLEAILSRDTANHPAHQRQAAFTPACFALPTSTAPRKLPTKATQIHMALRHRGRNFTARSESSSATLFPALHLHYKLATSESSSKKLFPAQHLHYKLARSESSSATLFPALHLHYKLATSESSSERLFPGLHLYYKLATSESSSKKLFPVLHLHYKLARSESSSEKLFPALHVHYKPATSQLRKALSRTTIALQTGQV